MTLDDTDRKILAMLQANARVTNADIAREVGMAPSGTLERIRKLEERGIVRGYEARLDPARVGLGITAFILVRSKDGPGGEGTGERLALLEEVQEVHHVAGEDCFVLKARVRDPKDLQRLLRDGIGTIPAISSTKTTIVLETVKETSRVTLSPPDDRPVLG
jgi:Lrp/AsnC family leucine-responsive transcriptional regulator